MTHKIESTRDMSDLQEIAISRAIDGRRTWNSGAGNFMKGDIVSKDFTVEAKTAMTEKKTFNIKKEWIDKVEEQTFANGKNHWALAFNFGGEQNQNNNYYVINEADFIMLKTYLEEL